MALPDHWIIFMYKCKTADQRLQVTAPDRKTANLKLGEYAVDPSDWDVEHQETVAEYKFGD